MRAACGKKRCDPVSGHPLAPNSRGSSGEKMVLFGYSSCFIRAWYNFHLASFADLRPLLSCSSYSCSRVCYIKQGWDLFRLRVSFRFVSPKRNETKRRGFENHRNETKRRGFENCRNVAKRNETRLRFGPFRSGPFRLSVRRSAFENSTGSQVAKVASHPPFSEPWSITYLLSYRKF